MAHTLTHTPRSGGRAFSQRSHRVDDPSRDDPLGTARGIIAGVLISILVFWLPLAVVLFH